MGCVPAVNLSARRELARRWATAADQPDEQGVGADGDEQQDADPECPPRSVGAHLVGVHEGERHADRRIRGARSATFVRENSLRGHDVSTVVANR